MASKNKYWTGIEELRDQEAFDAKAQNEFPAEMSVDEFLGKSSLSETSTGRRDFLKFLGFSVTAATLAACETPVIKSIPYVNKPEDITPGVANYYASTYVKGADYANVLVKTREGRPIYIKGNKQFGESKGSVNARINSSVLDLYNTARVQAPVLNGEEISWFNIDDYVAKAIAKTKADGKKVVFLTESVVSPSVQRAIDGLAQTVAGENGSALETVVYEPVSYSGILKANETTLGKAIIPSYDLAKAETIVAVGADFLNTWLNPTVLSNQYLENRNPENGKMSKHYQFETCMSLSGSNADVRVAIKPSEEGLVLAAIYNHIAKVKGEATLNGVSAELSAATKKAATDLLKNQGKSVVLAGSNAVALQLLSNQINVLLGNYGSVIQNNRPFNTLQFTEDKLDAFLADVKAGKVGLVITNNVNPVYSSSKAAEVKNALSKVSATVALTEYADETATVCKAIAPINNWLESWADSIAIDGEYALAQPVINNLYNTRQALESVLVWSGSKTNALDYIQETAQNYVDGLDAWNKLVHNGSVKTPLTVNTTVNSAVELAKIQSGLAKLSKVTGEYEVVLYQKTGIATGEFAANPWLQELPDPISKVTWDNYLTMAPSDVDALGLNDTIGEQSPASVVTLTIDGKEITAPVYPQPGQKAGTLGLALGYGRGANGENIGKAAFQTAEYGGYIEDENGVNKPIGVNAYPLVKNIDGSNIYFTAGSLTTTEEEYSLACTQTQHTVMGRTSVVRETSLTTFITADKEEYNPAHLLSVHGENGAEKVPVSEMDLWAEHPVEGVGHRWGMSVDLSLCLGCGSCITACHTENNVPVVGKDEVRRSRDMHWLRIDRYYSSAEEPKKAAGEAFSYGEMEKAEANPAVVHMPMMCQHCNHAPCETVCPVAATTHSNEGLNQMTYNRCIGTRYCANNCPYKVRRFNWFNYQAYKKFTEVNPAQDTMGRMVLNPDVAVRSRGVMEKCSLCVQRIQEGKLKAKKAGRPVRDGDVESACSESCPTDAIVFGDLNDKNSKIAKRADSKRAYSALEEVGTRPNIYYQVKVRNIEEKAEA